MGGLAGGWGGGFGLLLFARQKKKLKKKPQKESHLNCDAGAGSKKAGEGKQLAGPLLVIHLSVIEQREQMKTE